MDVKVVSSLQLAVMPDAAIMHAAGQPTVKQFVCVRLHRLCTHLAGIFCFAGVRLSHASQAKERGALL